MTRTPTRASRHTPQRGFTLIELLTAIAIIGFLASVIIASLNAARARARDTAIQAAVEELRVLMDQNYNDYDSYAALSLNVGWIGTDYTCENYPVSGSFATQFRNICQVIITNEPKGAGAYFYTGVNGTITGANTQTFSILAWLPGQGKYWCTGSSGRSSFNNSGNWSDPGCWSNP